MSSMLYYIRALVYLLVGLIFFLLSSCRSSHFPDYTETRNGLFYKLEDVGDGDRRARVGDYITAQVNMKTENDSVLFDTHKMGLDGAVTFILPSVEYEKDYREGYQFLCEGDSATFITNAHALFVKKNRSRIPRGMSLESIVRVGTKVLRIRTPKEHEEDMLLERAKMEKGEFEEKKTLDNYISECKILEQPVVNGLYHIQLAKGTGVSLDSGRIALLNYRGYFLNGRCFDSSFETQPFEYIVGTEEQLIPGLAIGVRRMYEGEKAKFIIPSHLAFGSNGSSTGIVPPFTTVIYEVELLKVQ